jgi:hypothetical protein
MCGGNGGTVSLVKSYHQSKIYDISLKLINRANPRSSIQLMTIFAIVGQLPAA